MLENWLLANLHRLGTDTLTGMPSLLVNRLWQSAQEGGKVSLHLWSVFVRTGLLEFGNETFEWHYTCSKCRRLPEVLKVLDDRQSKWLVDLKLDCHGLNKDDLYQLSSLRNIRSLTIRSHRENAVTERVLHSWVEAVKLNGAFLLLARMHITLPLSRHQQPGDRITRHALSGLQYYPALQLVCIDDASGRLLDLVKEGESLGTFAVSAPRDCWKLSYVATACSTLRAFIGFRSTTIDLNDDNRDGRSSAKVFLSRTAPGHAAAVLPTDHDDKQVNPSKKRRLKDGKSVPLDDILQGFSY